MGGVLPSERNRLGRTTGRGARIDYVGGGSLHQSATHSGSPLLIAIISVIDDSALIRCCQEAMSPLNFPAAEIKKGEESFNRYYPQLNRHGSVLLDSVRLKVIRSVLVGYYFREAGASKKARTSSEDERSTPPIIVCPAEQVSRSTYFVLDNVSLSCRLSNWSKISTLV